MLGELVGRAAELDRSQQLLDVVLLGRGQLSLLVGEPGIGKTVLAQRIAQTALERGCRVAWGRCWEAGGAPAYWPWSEVFRSLDADDPFAETDDASLDARDVRFRRFDAARQALARIARDGPLALVLDDLHAADLSSLHFLQFVAQGLPSLRMLVVGTYRDAEARLSRDAGSVLSKIAREGEVFALGRLLPEDVSAWVQRDAPGTSDAVARHVHALTEGNPLFVRELLRTSGSLDARRLPDTLRAMLAEHLARASAEARALLGVASVLGREISVADVCAISELDADAVDALLREATDAAIVEPMQGDAQRYAFTHVLLRDRLYAELAPSKRAALHWRAGKRFASDAADLATAAHHMLEACSVAPAADVAAVARDAARIAMARLAFEEAASLSLRALNILGPTASAELACDVEILLAEALIRSGEAGRGREHCVHAAAVAKSMKSAALQARAALAYGAEIASSAIDPTMVRLLREALKALRATSHDALRARVMARLAVAMTPPQSDTDLDTIDALAREALQIARNLDDPETLLFVAYFASNATAGAGYRISARERHRTIGLVIDLATELERGVVLVNAAPRWITSLREQGAQADAIAALEAYALRIRELPRPQYQWRLPMVRATMAILDGRLDEAERLGREGLAIAQAGGVSVGAVGWATHRITLALARRDPASIAPVAEGVISALAPFGTLSTLVAWVLAATGRHTEARERLAAERRDRFSVPVLLLAGDAALLLRDRELGERIFMTLEPHATDALILWGAPLGCGAFGPAPRVLGDLASLLGRTADARRFYEEAIAIGERMGAPTFVRQAEHGLAELGSSAPANAPAAPPRARAIHLVRQGEVWTITSFTKVTVRLQDAKGLHYLERLLAQPDREIHVTELYGMEERAGDAGPVLDATAKQAYKERLEALDDALEEALRFGDPDRAERARAEIDAIAGELVSATGLGGRERRAGSLSERARINVQRRIRHTLTLIEKQDPVLARYLDAAVRTGPYCSFRPV